MSRSTTDIGAQRKALVTGASSGIGKATAHALVGRGFDVIGTSRNANTIPESAKVDGVAYRSLDLSDINSLEAFADELGAVDVVVNNAGESQAGPLEELPTDAIERLFAINVFGPIRLTQLVLPSMRDRGYGRVVMVGSMLASFPLAYRSSYVASKAAIKGFADAARRETSPFGIHITTVEPGSINTGIGERRTRYLSENSPYTGEFDTVMAALRKNESSGIRADRVAATVVEAIVARKPKRLYAVGSKARLVFPLKRLASGEIIESVVARMHGLSR